jgi:glutamyl/glutaminyl-tRNA synthetase
MGMRLRYAPSPTGDLHAGRALVAVANHLLRLREGGALVLRIDDTDAERAVAGAEERLRADLAWLGILFDEGPDGGPLGPYRQSERADRHREEAERLLASGRAERLADGSVALPLPATTIEVPDLSRGAVRVSLDRAHPLVLLRPDGRPTYHLATVVDDADMGITHVVRGEDHLSNTARHLLLIEALGYEPPAFAHLPIVVGEDGAKMSGRAGAASIGALRAAGWAPAAVVDWLARAACPAVTALPASSPEVLATAFDPARLGHGTTRLDPDLLRTLGRDHLAQMDPEALADALDARLGADPVATRTLIPGLGEAANLDEAAALVGNVLRRPDVTTLGEGEGAAAEALVAALSGASEAIDVDGAAHILEDLGVGKRAVRRVLTGSDHGIPLPYVLAALGRDEMLARAEAARAHR